jgi:hypothetical protein
MQKILVAKFTLHPELFWFREYLHVAVALHHVRHQPIHSITTADLLSLENRKKINSNFGGIDLYILHYKSLYRI